MIKYLILFLLLINKIGLAQFHSIDIQSTQIITPHVPLKYFIDLPIPNLFGLPAWPSANYSYTKNKNCFGIGFTDKRLISLGKGYYPFMSFNPFLKKGDIMVFDRMRFLKLNYCRFYKLRHHFEISIGGGLNINKAVLEIVDTVYHNPQFLEPYDWVTHAETKTWVSPFLDFGIRRNFLKDKFFIEYKLTPTYFHKPLNIIIWYGYSLGYNFKFKKREKTSKQSI